MLFEVHITVKETDRVADWQQFCAERHISPLLIQLSRGIHQHQLMLAYQYNQLPGTRNLDQVHKLEESVQQEGFTILRTKVECPLRQAGNLVLALRQYRTRYTECHYKALLFPGIVQRTCAQIARYNLAVSKNLLQDKGSRGREKWFFTRRLYSDDFVKIQEEYDTLRLQLASHLIMTGADQEFVLYDTKPDLDKGWVTL